MSEVSRVSFCPLPFAFSACACARLACSTALACGPAHPAMVHTKAPLISVNLNVRGAFRLFTSVGEHNLHNRKNNNGEGEPHGASDSTPADWLAAVASNREVEGKNTPHHGHKTENNSAVKNDVVGGAGW